MRLDLEVKFNFTKLSFGDSEVLYATLRENVTARSAARVIECIHNKVGLLYFVLSKIERIHLDHAGHSPLCGPWATSAPP